MKTTRRRFLKMMGAAFVAPSIPKLAVAEEVPSALPEAVDVTINGRKVTGGDILAGEVVTLRYNKENNVFEVRR